MTEYTKTRERLNILRYELDQLGGFSTAVRQQQEYKSEHWDELIEFCVELLGATKSITKSKKSDSDNIHGEAFAAGISGRCSDCEVSNSHDELVAALEGLIKAFDIPLITKHNDPGFVRLRALQAAEQALEKAKVT